MTRRILGLLLLIVGMLAAAALGFWLGKGRGTRSPRWTPLASPKPTTTPSPRPPSPTSTPTARFQHAVTATPVTWRVFSEQGLALFALQEGLDPHLFAYHPLRLPWVRLMREPVRTPALDPSGRWVALSLHRRTWQLALLDLATGDLYPLAPRGLYEAAPAWSPDAQWLAYEALVDGNLDIWIRAARPDARPEEAIRLTRAPAADAEPAWSPQGRAVAFVSLRTGTPQVFVVNLDDPDTVLQVSREEKGAARHPSWSPDGRYLTWDQEEAGLHRLWLWDATQPETPPRAVGEGTWPRWRADGGGLWAVVPRPEGAYLVQYAFPSGPTLPLLPLPFGSVHGFTVGYSALADPLPPPLAAAARYTPTPPWRVRLTPAPELGPNQTLLVEVSGVQAPYPYLSDAVDEAFRALRTALQARLGWDPLAHASLYRPPSLADPLPEDADWLATGRAFALPLDELMDGRMVVVREAFPQATYWRVYLRPEAQDGTRGRPLTTSVWDFLAGREVPPPPGFWVDFTAMAAAFGWERLPALPTWPTYYPAARFHIFVHRAGLSWNEAFQAVHGGTGTPTPLWPTPTPTYTPTPLSPPATTAAPEATP